MGGRGSLKRWRGSLRDLSVGKRSVLPDDPIGPRLDKVGVQSLTGINPAPARRCERLLNDMYGVVVRCPRREPELCLAVLMRREPPVSVSYETGVMHKWEMRPELEDGRFSLFVVDPPVRG